MKPGPVTSDQLARFGQTWKQGQHVLVTGPTGSGKTALARWIGEEHIRRGGFYAVFVGKLSDDPTILEDYSEKDGWVRWTKWRKPKVFENKVLLWPDTSKIKNLRQKVIHQKAVFEHAFNSLSNSGKWTVQIDEGLYTVHPEFLNLGGNLAMLHAMGRSSKLTIVTLAQRPAHLPLIVYSSASHAFVGRARELADNKRLAELGSKESSKELSEKIRQLDTHQFLWIPVSTGKDPEVVDLSR